MVPALILSLYILPLFAQEAPVENGSTANNEGFFDEDLPLMEGEELTITASPETTQQMKVVTKEEIDQVQAADLATLLQEALGLGITRYGGYGNLTAINMRGFNSERIAFLIDGVPANSPMTGEFDLNQIDIKTVERIEVIYGGSDSKYNVSGALGGVVNIITVKKQKTGLNIVGSITNTSALPGQYRDWDGNKVKPHWEDLADTQNYSVFAGFGAEKYSWTANLFANRAGNHFLYKDTIFNTTRRKENNDVWDTGVSASYVLDLPDDYSKLIASGDLYYGDKDIPTSGMAIIAGKQTDFSTRENLMLDMPRIGRDDLATEASLSYSWQRMDYTGPANRPSGVINSDDGGISSRHDQQIVTAINRWSWYPLSKLTLRTGWDYRFNHLDSTDNGLRSRHDGGVYLTAEYMPQKVFTIIPSIKAVFSSPSAMLVVPVPKLGFLWKPLDSLSFKNNYFRSFKYPDFEDLYWSGDPRTQGNPNLKPEDGWGGDLGANWHYKNFINIESTFFSQWTEDSIHWSAGRGGVWSPQNVGKAIYFGLDSKAGSEIPLSAGPFKKIGISFYYQYLLSYLLSGGYDYDSDKRIPYMPMHTLGGSVSISWKTFVRGLEGSLLITCHYEGLRYANTSNITELDPQFLLNAHVNQRIGKNFTVFAAANNILDSSYESYEGYPMPGLTVTLGMRFNIEPKKEKQIE